MKTNLDYLTYFDDYKSYGDENSEFNPDDFESDYWEHTIPDVDDLAEALDRNLEDELYAYDDYREDTLFQKYYPEDEPSDSVLEIVDENSKDEGIPLDD